MWRTTCLLLCLLIGCTSPEVIPPTPKPISSPTPTVKGDAHVEFVRVVQSGAGAYTFHVTVRHDDTGWDDYADGWDVVLPDGAVLKADGNASPFTRLLLHPHENEQPFTRSQSGLQISAEIETVTVRAHDLLHGFGGQEVVVDLTVAEGEDFVVER